MTRYLISIFFNRNFPEECIVPKKEYVSRSITNVGDTEACPICKKSDDYISAVVKHDNRTTYTKIDADSEEGEKIAEEEDIKSIPYIKDCKTYKDGDKERTRCRTIEGFDEGDWSDFKKLVPKEEMEKIEAKIDEDAEISEPLEPEEPSEDEEEEDEPSS